MWVVSHSSDDHFGVAGSELGRRVAFKHFTGDYFFRSVKVIVWEEFLSQGGVGGREFVDVKKQ
jgi:hypothetical protein